MKFNENIAISTPRVLLVPYDAHHVPQYHAWMEDAAIREATASDRLTLEEEYENQVSWRTSADKLTFILCEPLNSAPPGERGQNVIAGEADSNDRMIGDINMFLTPWENDEDESESGRLGVDHVRQSASQGSGPRYCVGEVDIMIANVEKRGRGMGRAAVSTFLWFVKKNVRGILAEYATSIGEGDILEMKELLVRIKATNEGSIALFKGYGFEQRGEVNYFGEVAMILKESSSLDGVKGVEGYEELQFDRSGLSK